jgi:hypothetical protein
MTAYEGHVRTCPLDETERERRKRKGWGLVFVVLFLFIFSPASYSFIVFFFHVAGNYSSSGSLASMDLITDFQAPGRFENRRRHVPRFLIY